MTYGKWKALQPVVVVVEPEPEEVLEEKHKICQNCGVKLPKDTHANTRYCWGCKDIIHRRNSLEHYRKKRGMVADGKI